jgi:hypothetical protein
MHIKALRPVSIGPGRGLGAGEVADVRDDVAALLISMGKAVRFTPAPVPVAKPVIIETASVQPNKGATKAKAPKR